MSGHVSRMRERRGAQIIPQKLGAADTKTPIGYDPSQFYLVRLLGVVS